MDKSQKHTRESETNTLRVRGEGIVQATPDQVQITMGVTTLNESIIDAQQENAMAINAVISSLIELGIPEQDIQTTVYRIDPEYDYIEGVQVFHGYRVAHLLRVTLDQIGIAGVVIDSAVKNGVNSIASIHYTVKDPSPFYQQALTNAVENALGKAIVLADALNVTLNPTPIDVKEIDRSQIQERYPTVLAAQTATTAIQPGQLTFEASIEALFSYF
ncbi:SIMPL domain-containing protein [Halalkalibacter krulwichiae]|uniref:26 kDa periplasmic immunogenic protein n=1 Tax=Halalkalibacter krulwichiae TaxID=199441 RepID=A0A1X9MI40_9BACI|nr:SIMPL domain-containing protein [Halalkalibacter krulwichiae]ARK30212.1 26 kDa periplasmic immunogenic protein precursor [Halalkalibacter krulwichiae]